MSDHKALVVTIRTIDFKLFFLEQPNDHNTDLHSTLHGEHFDACTYVMFFMYFLFISYIIRHYGLEKYPLNVCPLEAFLSR